MRAVVSGGVGFIGSALCRYLVGKCGWKALNIDKLTYAADLRSLAKIEGASGYRFVQADKLENQLGWQPHYDLARGLRDIVAWYLNHA